jgi:hypothetical protein
MVTQTHNEDGNGPNGYNIYTQRSIKLILHKSIEPSGMESDDHQKGSQEEKGVLNYMP